MSTNLLAALDCALSLTQCRQKFDRVHQKTRLLRAALRHHGLPPLAQDAHAASGIVTVAVLPDIEAADIGAALFQQGIEIAYQSRYLQPRNWLQICLMGELDEAALLPIASRTGQTRREPAMCAPWFTRPHASL